MAELRLGIVGAAGRGASFKDAIAATGEAVIAAVCDSNAAKLDEAQANLGAAQKYLDFDDMLARAALDAVIVATPVMLHVRQSIAALDQGVHVLCEVPAAVSIDECRALTLAVRRSKATFMMAENYTYMRNNVLVRELVRRGLFGETYFAEAEYIHELKAYNEVTPWRRKWQTGINGNTYPTHSLGLVLQWMLGQRVTSVCCAGSGRRHADPRGEKYEQEASTLTLCRTDKGGLIKLRLDMLSDRPHAMTNYQLQGMDGCYESSRAEGDSDRIWLRSKSKGRNEWMKLAELEAEFLPEMWRSPSEAAKKSGHGGGDYFEVLDFLDACRRRRLAEIGIDAAMDMTLPGLCSQLSIAQAGRWVEVPDSRAWTAETVHYDGQLHMVLPESVPVADPVLPAGYRMRQMTLADMGKYATLMERAGFGGWTIERVQGWMDRALEGGLFVVEHVTTGALVATALANPGPTSLHPKGGELGWVAADPGHSGKGLGRTVCAAVVGLFRSRGYRHIYLTTDDSRLPAISVYFKLGFEPLMYKDDMPGRWAAVQNAMRLAR